MVYQKLPGIYRKSPLKDAGHGGKKEHSHFASKGTTKKVVNKVKKKAKEIYEDPIGEYVKPYKAVWKWAKDLKKWRNYSYYYL